MVNSETKSERRSFRFTVVTVERVEALARRLELSPTDIVQMAVRELHERVVLNGKAPSKRKGATIAPPRDRS